MKIKIERWYDLPEDQSEFDIHSRSLEFYCALSDVGEHCRRYMKYEDITDETYGILQEIRNLVPELD